MPLTMRKLWLAALGCGRELAAYLGALWPLWRCLVARDWTVSRTVNNLPLQVKRVARESLAKALLEAAQLHAKICIACTSIRACCACMLFFTARVAGVRICSTSCQTFIHVLYHAKSVFINPDKLAQGAG